MDDPKPPEVEVLDLTTPEAQKTAGVKPAPDDVPVPEGEAIATIRAVRRDVIVDCSVHGLERQPTWSAVLTADPRAMTSLRAESYCMEAYISVTLALLSTLHSEGIVLASEGEVTNPKSVVGFRGGRH